MREDVYPERKGAIAPLFTQPCPICGATDWNEQAEIAVPIIRDEKFYHVRGPFWTAS
jgi:hypothetical protein